MSQIQKILEKLNEGRWVCSTELIDLYCVDYRARINDLRKKGYIINGEPCKGRCGKNHNASLSRWYLELNPAKFESPIVKQFREEYELRIKQKQNVGQTLFT